MIWVWAQLFVVCMSLLVDHTLLIHIVMNYNYKTVSENWIINLSRTRMCLTQRRRSRWRHLEVCSRSWHLSRKKPLVWTKVYSTCIATRSVRAVYGHIEIITGDGWFGGEQHLDLATWHGGYTQIWLSWNLKPSIPHTHPCPVMISLSGPLYQWKCTTL